MVASLPSRGQRAPAPSSFARSLGALHFDGSRGQPAFAPLVLGVLLGQLRGSLERLGNARVQPGQLGPPVPPLNGLEPVGTGSADERELRTDATA
jgi:hypothetical protein